MNKDQIEGRLQETGGKVKEIAGRALGKRNLEHRGLAQQATGRAQAGYGDVKNELKKGK